MMTHKELVRKMLKQPAVKAEYDAQAEEFAWLDELLRARRKAGLTQAEVGARMGTKTPAVAGLGGGGDGYQGAGGGGAGGGGRQPAALAVGGHPAQVRAGRRVPPGDPAA